MFLEYWMIAVFVLVICYLLYKTYIDGYTKGVAEMSVVTMDHVLAILKSKKIIDIVQDENGEDKIIPGGIDEYLKENEK